ncbi:hypothetical protein JCM8202v2_005542 [Rhodotorula sphaerocarpa]
MGGEQAQLKHAEKYVEAYRKLYPETTVLLVRSNPIDFFRRSAFLAAIRPAADLLRSRTNGLAGPQSDLLVHTLSNGGCLTLQELNEQLRRTGLQSPPPPEPREKDEVATIDVQRPAEGIPARAFVYDSCPGLSTLTSSIRAFSAGIRNPLAYYPAVVAISAMYGLLRFWSILRRQPSTLSRISAYLNSAALPSVPRLYLYSPVDELIPPEDVERHAAEARSGAGIRDVRLERFEKSPHVAHARTDPERYWGAIRRVWKESAEERRT